MSGAVIAANQSLKVNGVVNASVALATNTTQQVLYTAPANGYALVNIGCYVLGSLGQVTLRVGSVIVYQYVGGNNDATFQYQQVKPNGMQEGPGSPVTGIKFNDAALPVGSSFLNVPVGPGQTVTIQKGSNFVGGTGTVSGVEFINSP
jgi:hypothetical protein